MKKVTKEGAIPETTANCPICECEFIYDRTEVIKISESEYHVECPRCKESLTITYENKKTLKIF